MLMQNFGVTNEEHYGMLWYFWSGQWRAYFPGQRLEFEPSVLSVWLVTPGCFCSRSSEGNNIDWNF